MSTYSNQLQPALQNLLQRVVQFFHPRSSCTTMHISVDVQRITLNESCMTISGGRTKQLVIFCRDTGFTSDFLSFIVTQFFHGALQLSVCQYVCLSVPCLTQSWEQNGLGTWKLAGRKPMTRVTRDPTTINAVTESARSSKWEGPQTSNLVYGWITMTRISDTQRP